MAKYIRGALVEYENNTVESYHNIVAFQFNPENLTRYIHIPTYTRGSRTMETWQSGEVPYETISITAHFSASDQLNNGNQIALSYGVGPLLAALEIMAHPVKRETTTSQQDADKVAEKMQKNKDAKKATQRTPREEYRPLLFVWGSNRILPVYISSLNIVEQQFDAKLNPIQAEATIELSVVTITKSNKDQIAAGAAEYTLKHRIDNQVEYAQVYDKEIQSAIKWARNVVKEIETISF